MSHFIKYGKAFNWFTHMVVSFPFVISIQSQINGTTVFNLTQQHPFVGLQTHLHFSSTRSSQSGHFFWSCGLSHWATQQPFSNVNHEPHTQLVGWFVQVIGAQQLLFNVYQGLQTKAFQLNVGFKNQLHWLLQYISAQFDNLDLVVFQNFQSIHTEHFHQTSCILVCIAFTLLTHLSFQQARLSKLNILRKTIELVHKDCDLLSYCKVAAQEKLKQANGWTFDDHVYQEHAQYVIELKKDNHKKTIKAYFEIFCIFFILYMKYKIIS